MCQRQRIKKYILLLSFSCSQMEHGDGEGDFETQLTTSETSMVKYWSYFWKRLYRTSTLQHIFEGRELGNTVGNVQQKFRSIQKRYRSLQGNVQQPDDGLSQDVGQRRDNEPLQDDGLCVLCHRLSCCSLTGQPTHLAQPCSTPGWFSLWQLMRVWLVHCCSLLRLMIIAEIQISII